MSKHPSQVYWLRLLNKIFEFFFSFYRTHLDDPKIELCRHGNNLKLILNMEFGKIEKKNLRPSGSWNPDWKTEKSNLEKHKCIHQVIDNDDEYSPPYLIRQNRLCPDQRTKEKFLWPTDLIRYVRGFSGSWIPDWSHEINSFVIHSCCKPCCPTSF